MVEKGLSSFIKQKLEHSVDVQSIKHSLMRAGFAENRIDAAFEYVRKTASEAHRAAMEKNNFLPPLAKSRAGLASTATPASVAHAHEVDIHIQHGLFRGRLRRKDFILGFLFFFGLGYIALVFAGVFLSILFPTLWASILSAAETDTQGLLFLAIPLVLFPVTIMLFSLIARRLHNLDMPGGIGLVFLILFVSPAGAMNFYGLWLMYATVVILFIVLMTMKGDPAPNMHGAFPASHGSFFRRIFNV